MKERIFIPHKEIDEKLISYITVDCGHDCWGNSESYSQKCVEIKGKKVKIWDDWFLEVNAEGEPLDIVLQYNIDNYLKEKSHFDKTSFRTPAEYKAYLKGKYENKTI